MGYYKTIFFLVILFVSKLQALSISVTGATAFVQDATTTTNLTINAGLAMPDNCESTDNINTCNSCTGKTLTSAGKTFPAPCNEASIYSNLVLTISVNSDKTDINGLVVSASKSATYSDTKFSTAIPDTTANGKSYSFSASWGTLISEITSSDSGSGTFNITDCTTNCGGTRTFYFGPIKDSAYVEKIAVTINLSIINSTTSAELNSVTRALTGVCPLTVNGGLTTAYSSYGLCYYEIIPGDEKVYIADNIPGWGSSPKEPDTGLKLSSVVMYYAEQDSGVSALETLKKIQNNSPKASLEITDSSTDPLGEYKISDLSNDKSYCFMSALKDITGNIQYFMDVQQVNTLSPAVSDTDLESLTYSKFCAQPSEVIGVLGDKNCFIATATFGSSLHPYLNILRKFRDTFLIQHYWGKKFIKWYYKNGPIGAKWINENPEIKPVMQVLLLPVIAGAYVFNEYFTLLVIILLVTLFLGYFYKQKKGTSFSFFFFICILVLNFPASSLAQSEGSADDEFMETTAKPTETIPEAPGESAPNEPPYTKTEDQLAAEKMKETSKSKSEDVSLKKKSDEIPLSEVKPSPKKIISEADEKKNNKLPVAIEDDKKETYRIQHPDAAKGLYLIDQNTGRYYYKIGKKSQKNQTTSVRFGMVDPPNISASRDDGSSFVFTDMYGEGSLPFLQVDYEWQPFTTFGKMGFNLGMGFFTASGNGKYTNSTVDAKYGSAREHFTFIGAPISAGVIYRLELTHRQWFVPFVNGGLSYYGLAEIRDDGKKPKIVGSPAGYAGGGLMLNITAWDRSIAFTMDNEYGINNMWLTAEYKLIQSFNEDLDISSNVFNIGISVDY